MRTDLADHIADLYKRIAALEQRFANQRRKGTIAEVDTDKGMARVKLADGADGKPVLSPWVPWQTPAMGAMKWNIPPSVDEQVTIESDSGDMTDGVIANSLRSNANPQPGAKPGEMHMTNAGFKMFVDQAGNVVIESSVGITLKGPTITIDGDIVHTGDNQQTGVHVDSNGPH